MRKITYLLFLFPLFWACGTPDSAPEPKEPEVKIVPYEFKETIATGTDTGMKDLRTFKRKDPQELYYQCWRAVKFDKEGKPKPPDPGPGELLALYPDSSLFTSMGGKAETGSWRFAHTSTEKAIQLTINGQRVRFLVTELKSDQLTLSFAGNSFYYFVSDGRVHQNYHNDPFYPTHASWMVKPSKKESDLAIKERMQKSLKFYALYFRDQIKRGKEDLSAQGLPDVFDWYQRGISLPDKELISDAFIDCFYDQKQAEKGYDLIRNLMKDHDFEWPKKAPNWLYRTQPVLEQMYHKMRMAK